MGNRTAKFISVLVGSIIAGAPIAAVSQNAPTAPSAASTANAASDCLASPKGVAPQGQHWFYRLERATKRQCWYLRAEGGKAATTAQAASGTTPQPESPPPQSVQNARAEYVAPQAAPAQAAQTTVAAPMATQPAQTSGNEPQQPAVATRWPDAAATAVTPAPQPVTAPTDNSVQPSATPAASPAPAPVTLAAADASTDKPTGSLQTLLLVVGGALALAGLLASVIYRFAGGRVRVQTNDRRINWDQRDDDDDSRAPWHAAQALHAERPRPVDFDAIRLQISRPQSSQITDFSNEIRRIAAQAPTTRIEVAEPEEDQIELFEDDFEIVAPAPQLAVDDMIDEQSIAHDLEAHADDVRDEHTVDIDIITAMLEKLATDGPRLEQPSLEADLAALARSSRGQSAARA